MSKKKPEFATEHAAEVARQLRERWEASPEWTPEQRVAASIAERRAAAGLTYEALAFRMKARGVSIHPSAIQKTEKSGRKASIDELVAYANIFNVPVEELWGGVSREVRTVAYWKDIQAAVSLLEIMDQVQDRFDALISGVRGELKGNTDLRTQVEEWLAENLTSDRADLHTKFDYPGELNEDGEWIGAEAASEKFIDEWLEAHPSPAVETARLVLADDDGEQSRKKGASDGK